MSRFYGTVGYITTEETRPGIYEEREVQRCYFGDIIKPKTSWQQGMGINDNLNLSVEISIMADPYAYDHFSEIKYVECMGTKWKVNSAIPDRPRISLFLGGLWNGQQG